MPFSRTERARVLLTVKASPEIGRTHGETVCVAGVRLDVGEPSWIRLFPVPWEWFWGSTHRKYQVIDVDVVKHDRDQRPESHRPVLDTVDVVDQLDPGPQRSRILDRLPQPTMCDVIAARGWGRTSLALTVPREVTGFEWEDQTGDPALLRNMNRAAQPSLLIPGAPRLEFCPITFRFQYRCWAATCRGHSQPIMDWEISEAWRRWRTSYPDDHVDRLQEKWLSLVRSDRRPAFYVGNQHQAPQSFMVLGVARDIRSRGPSPEDRASPAPQPRSTGDSQLDQPHSREGRLFDL